MMVERLTDDALDVIIDVVMATTKRLPRRLVAARQYWVDITSDYWGEWTDRSIGWARRLGESNAPVTS